MKCYYCDNTHSNLMGWDCTADSPGFQVQCQMDSKEESYYGDACIVAHTGKIPLMKLWLNESLDNTRIRYFYHSIVIFKSLVDNINGSVVWKRNCIDGKDMIFGCSERVIPESGIFVDACICDSPLCNEKMGNIPETTTKSSVSTTASSIPNIKPHSNLLYLFFFICVILNRYPI